MQIDARNGAIQVKYADGVIVRIPDITKLSTNEITSILSVTSFAKMGLHIAWTGSAVATARSLADLNDVIAHANDEAPIE